MSEDPEIEMFPLAQRLSSGGQEVSVEIYRIKGEVSWTLEVVDDFNNSTVWDESFATDSAALTEAKRTILSEGIGSLIGPEGGKGRGGWG